MTPRVGPRATKTKLCKYRFKIKLSASKWENFKMARSAAVKDFTAGSPLRKKISKHNFNELICWDSLTGIEAQQQNRKC